MPSMQNYINGNTIANEIRMLSSTHSGAFLIVEGITDFRFYKQFIDKEKCIITIAINDKNLCQAISILDNHGFSRVIGIIDADFRRLNSEPVISRNVVMTDTHDLETMIIKSSGFEGVLCEYCDEEVLSRFISNRDLREILLNSAKTIGYVRWYSNINSLMLRFKELDFNEFLSNTNLSVDLTKLVYSVIINSPSCTISNQPLMNGIQSLSRSQIDLWQLCQGHDVCEILLIGLKSIFGSSNVRNLHRGSLEGDLRLAYNPSDFINTDLCRAISQWQISNPGIIVLNEEFTSS